MNTIRPGNLLIVAALTAFATNALAAGGGGSPIVIVADTRNLTGLMAWWANLYNESNLQFTLLTIVLIRAMGRVFGLLGEVGMRKIGIDLNSLELSEH